MYNNIIYRYGTGTLTSVFLDRVFQECLTYEGEMVSDLLLINTVLILLNFFCFVIGMYRHFSKCICEISV